MISLDGVNGQVALSHRTSLRRWEVKISAALLSLDADWFFDCESMLSDSHRGYSFLQYQGDATNTATRQGVKMHNVCVDALYILDGESFRREASSPSCILQSSIYIYIYESVPLWGRPVLGRHFEYLSYKS